MNDPFAGTTFLITAVASFVRITHSTIELVVQNEFVTTRLVAAAAKLTVPDGLSIVAAPVVPPAVIVVSKVILPVNNDGDVDRQ